MIEIKWLGRGGQGAFTASRLLGVAAGLFEGKSVMAFPSFGPERRGAPVQAFTKLAEEKIRDRSEITTCDYIVLLDESLVTAQLYDSLKPGGAVIINTQHPEKYQDFGRTVTLDATALALEVLKRPITNTAMLGALLGASEIISLESAIKAVEQELAPNIVAKNIAILKLAYAQVKEEL